MDSSVVIFLNEKAIKVDELFLNENWSLTEIFDHIYSITVRNKRLKWLVKTYDKKKHAEKESTNLFFLKNIKNIPKVLAVGFSDTLNYVILSEAPGMDLFDYIQKYDVMTESEVRNIAKQLLKTINSMHSYNVIHKDIKPENIIYDKETRKITLIDFEEKYTDEYRSPELVNGEELTEKTDIWSTGITLYYLMTGNVPFHTEKEILRKKLVFPKKWSEDFKDFMSCLIERDLVMRYTAEDALDHIWITVN